MRSTGPIRLASLSGVAIPVNANGSIWRIDHEGVIRCRSARAGKTVSRGSESQRPSIPMTTSIEQGRPPRGDRRRIAGGHMENEQGVGRLRFLDPPAGLFRSHARAQTAEERAGDRDPRRLRRRLVTSGTRCATAVCVAMVLVLAFPAAAQVHLECSSWRRLSEDQKLQTLDRTIEDLISGSRGREYTSINRTQTWRCLESHRNQMVDDFDELCSQGTRADLGALNRTFRSYVWSCAQ
jgi:hypothetical protein